jgi:hypothetical protein
MWFACPECGMLFIIYEIDVDQEKEFCPRCHIKGTPLEEAKKKNGKHEIRPKGSTEGRNNLDDNATHIRHRRKKT